MSRWSRRVVTAAVGLGVLAAFAAPAAAHVTVSPDEAARGGYAVLELRVPHGCDGSPTVAVAVQIPAGVVSVTPEQVAGWEVETTVGRLAEPYESHGETITEGVTSVAWTGGPLPDDQFASFGLSVKLPDDGDEVAFPVVQRCVEGETRWIDLPTAGAEEPEHPAPVVTLVAASQRATDGAVDDSMSTTWSIVAFLVAAVALVLAGASFASSRRRT